MKKLLILSLASLVSLASSSDEIVAKTLFSDGSTNTWTQADLIAALQLMNRKYHRDVESPSGRAAWHGRLVEQVVDTNKEVKVERYADGKEFVFRWRDRKANVKAANTKLPRRAVTNGIPVALAAARQRQLDNAATTNIVTVTINAGR